MPYRMAKTCWYDFTQRRGRRRWIASITAFQILAVFIYFQSSTTGFNHRIQNQLNNDDTRLIAADGRNTFDNAARKPFDSRKTLHLQDDSRQYFQTIASGVLCYVEGTDLPRSSSSGCVCKEDYYGNECGIPASVWHRTVKSKYNRWVIKPRQVPRRIIHGLNINHEIDFFQVRLEELKDAVDAYIVCESNYTAFGKQKPLYLLDRLHTGFMDHFHEKIVYVPLLRFPSKGANDGWFMDMYLRYYMGLGGLQRIYNIKPDDLFVLLDADEIPTREVLMFLKLYDGYPEPIRLAMRWSVFGFYWKRKQEKSQSDSLLNWLLQVVGGSSSSPMNKEQSSNYEEELLEVTAVSTMEMVWRVCLNNTFLIRKDMSTFEEFQDRLSRYRAEGHRVNPWTAGTREHYAGYHCSWCYKPDGIRTKLLSAHKDDKPRWGDFPEKADLKYIEQLITNGEWFDGSKPFFEANWEEEKEYAPKYILRHLEDFSHLLYPPEPKFNTSTISN